MNNFNNLQYDWIVLQVDCCCWRPEGPFSRSFGGSYSAACRGLERRLIDNCRRQRIEIDVFLLWFVAPRSLRRQLGPPIVV